MKINYLPIFLGCVFIAGCNNNQKEVNSGATDSLNAITTTIYPDSLIKKIHLCTQLPVSTTLPPEGGKKGAGARIYFMWPRNTKVLNVTFLDGDPRVQKRIEETAKQWEQYCGVKFNFGSFQNPDISISFKYSGSWSWIGKSSKDHIPSMNFGWLYPNTEQDEYSRVVLHEFGHALGLVHEHQNPNGNPIKWDKPMVYKYYTSSQPDWTKEDVDNNLFAKYSTDEINGTNFDPHSIMLYAFPKELTLDGYSTGWNTQLSELDKSFIGRIYPIM